MTTRKTTAISSTWVCSKTIYQSTPFADSSLLSLALSTGPVAPVGGPQSRYGYVYMPLLAPLGATATAASLTLYLRKAITVDTTVNVRLTAESWAATKLTWLRRPTITDSGAILTSVTVKAGTKKGTAVVLDLKDVIAPALAGDRPWNGLVLTASSSIDFMAEGNGASSPVWSVTWDNRPDEPTGLMPSGGAVATPTPRLSWEFADWGGDRTLQRVHVQIATDAQMTNVVYDSGEVKSIVAGHTPAGFVAEQGATYYWRARHADGSSLWNKGWSDVVSFDYVPLPELAVTGFSGATFGDPTPLILAEMAGMVAYQVEVRLGSKIVHLSKKITDDVVNYQIPRNVIRYDDRDYTFTVRGWDGVDRVGASGAPTYRTVTWSSRYDDDLAVVPVSWQSAEPMSPRPGVLLRWGRSTPADRYAIWRAEGDDVLELASARLVEVVDADEVLDDDGNAFSWLDVTVGSGAYTYLVAAIENGQSSVRRYSTPVVSAVVGRWLIAEDGEMVGLFHSDGAGDHGLELSEDSEEILLANGDTAIITTAFRGYSGEVRGEVGDAIPGFGSQTLEEAVALIKRIRLEQRARYAISDLNIPVKTINLNVVRRHPEHVRKAVVTGRVVQDGEQERYGLVGDWQ